MFENTPCVMSTFIKKRIRQWVYCFILDCTWSCMETV